jgi:hypothetical protein
MRNLPRITQVIDGIYDPNREAKGNQADGFNLNRENFSKEQRTGNRPAYNIKA